MKRSAAGAATASLPRSLYPRESLAAAAAALGARARVGLGPDGKARWKISVEAEGRGGAALCLAEILNEALSHARRQSRLRAERAGTAVIVLRLLSKGFPSSPADPLEQLEPSVRLDRAEETTALLEAARRRK